MTYRICGRTVPSPRDARLQLARELRAAADRLEGREPDYLVLHDTWDRLLELCEQTHGLSVRFLGEYPEEEARLIKKRFWLDPKLELIGIKKRA